MQRRHSLRHLFWRGVVATAGTVGIGLGVYPVANLVGTAVSRMRARRRQPPGFAGTVAREWAMAALVSASRPIGIFGLPVVRPGARGPRPVILIHGFAMGRANFLILANRLSLAGLGPIVGFEYWTLGKVESAAAELSKVVDDVRAATGAAKVDLIGHSMGAMVARAFVTVGGGAVSVANLVTIGAPHQGTPMHRFGVGAPAIELKGGSDLLTRLAATPLPEGVKTFAIWSRSDGLVSSRQHAEWPGTEELVYDDLGHLSMLASPRVAREIIVRLKR